MVAGYSHLSCLLLCDVCLGVVETNFFLVHRLVYLLLSQMIKDDVLLFDRYENYKRPLLKDWKWSAFMILLGMH